MLAGSATLDERAAEINRLFDRADQADIRANHQRLAAGAELIAAKALVRHGEWQAWCKANIQRSAGDIRKVMHMAGAEDPMAELEAERARTRKAVANLRSKSGLRKPLLPEPMEDTTTEEPETPDEPESTVVRFPSRVSETDSRAARVAGALETLAYVLPLIRSEMGKASADTELAILDRLADAVGQARTRPWAGRAQPRAAKA